MKQKLSKKAQEEGFGNIDDFIKANLRYLPEEKQDLFQRIVALEKTMYNSYREQYREAYYGKG